MLYYIICFRQNCCNVWVFFAFPSAAQVCVSVSLLLRDHNQGGDCQTRPCTYFFGTAHAHCPIAPWKPFITYNKCSSIVHRNVIWNQALVNTMVHAVRVFDVLQRIRVPKPLAHSLSHNPHTRHHMCVRCAGSTVINSGCFKMRCSELTFFLERTLDNFPSRLSTARIYLIPA